MPKKKKKYFEGYQSNQAAAPLNQPVINPQAQEEESISASYLKKDVNRVVITIFSFVLFCVILYFLEVKWQYLTVVSDNITSLVIK